MEKPLTKEWVMVLNWLDPLTRALFKCCAVLEPIPPGASKIFVEMRNLNMLKIAEDKRESLKQALTIVLGRDFTLCLYTLEPLRELAKMNCQDD